MEQHGELAHVFTDVFIQNKNTFLLLKFEINPVCKMKDIYKCIKNYKIKTNLCPVIL